MKITQICDDGTIYLVTDDEERCVPWEEDIKNVDALPIDKGVLMGFGFRCNNRTEEYKLFVGDDCELVYSLSAKCYCLRYKTYNNNWHYASTVKELQYKLYRFDKYDLRLEWKGIEK